MKEDSLLFLRHLLLIGALVLICIPYGLHISQDLPWPINHDEAQIHLNAKDISLFGPESLEYDKHIGLLFALNTIIGMVSFSIFGPSIFSLRIFYILLNMFANLLFFDYIRRRRGTAAALIITAAFALHPFRLALGKAAMAESLTLPLTLILIWSFGYLRKYAKSYLLTGVLIVFIAVSKLDNSILSACAMAYAAYTLYVSWRNEGRETAVKKTSYLLGGVTLAAAFLLGVYAFAGFDKIVEELAYIKYCNQGVLTAIFRDPSVSVAIIKAVVAKNIIFTHRQYLGFSIVTLISATAGLLLMIFSKKERRDQLLAPILILSVLLLFKILFSSPLYGRRVAPIYPLPFLLIAYSFGAPWVEILKQKGLRPLSTLTRISFGHGSLAKAVSLGMIILLCLLTYVPDRFNVLADMLARPTYHFYQEGQSVSRMIGTAYKSLMLDGHLAYAAIQSRSKFIDIKPDMSMQEVYSVTSNPLLARRLIIDDPEIRFVFLLQENRQAGRMITEEFNAAPAMKDLTGGGFLYVLPQRKIPQT